MRVLQRSVFPQRYAQSKSNTGCFTEEALLQQWCGNEVLVLHHQDVTERSSRRLRSRWVFLKNGTTTKVRILGMDGALNF